ncbi:MAG TPA: response regulator transcription factor [Lacibacter sp.]|nr:response regulator transcription factor [Lacibacter sp.]HMO87592.1 response regulator transcription factor [Lacibacter sp.]HMP86035.1 response regulator transcription factor [Lacibacter sp.]
MTANTTANKHITLAFVDDHVLLRDAVANLMGQQKDFHVLFKAGNGEEMIDCIPKYGKPDILVLDLSMPVMDGYESAAWLRQNHPDIKILVLTMFDTDIPLIRLLQQGVRGFIKKDAHPDELQLAIRTLYQEGYYYPQQVVGKMAGMFQLKDNKRMQVDITQLSTPELDFLRMACTELTYKEIALKVNASPKTIDAMRDQLFVRIGVKSRIGLAMFAVKNGVVHI